MTRPRNRRVLQSLEFDGGLRCVDVFVRSDGSYGFELYRRDPEDGHGWYPIGGYEEMRFECEAAARNEAARRVPGLAKASD